MHRLFLFSLLLIVTSCAHRPVTPSDNIELFKKIVRSGAHDEAKFADLKKLSPKLSDADLLEIETIGRKEDGSFAAVYLLVSRGKFDSAVQLIAGALKVGSNRSYSMWKWWEDSFRERKDYNELSQKLGNAFVKLFERSDEDIRKVIADIFDKQNLSVEELKTIVHQNSKR